MPIKIIIDCETREQTAVELTQAEIEWRETLAELAAETEVARQAFRQQIVDIAQSAVGIALNDLTAVQIKALIAVMLYRMGGVSGDMEVKPLNEWVR